MKLKKIIALVLFCVILTLSLSSCVVIEAVMGGEKYTRITLAYTHHEETVTLASLLPLVNAPVEIFVPPTTLRPLRHVMIETIHRVRRNCRIPLQNESVVLRLLLAVD